MAIGISFTEPGVYSQFKPQTVLPVLPGGIRVAALVGDGRQTNVVSGETITRSSTPGGSDALAHTATVLGSQIIDEDQVTYYLTTDYTLSSGSVSWSPSSAASLTGTVSQTYNGLVGLTFKFTVGNGSEQTITFLNGDFVSPTAATATEVAAAITARGTGVSSSVSSNKVVVATSATSNTSLLIGNGTANSILGFSEGSLVLTPREPASGKKYTVSYEYAKVSADYSVRFFFNMNDVVAQHGDVSTSNTLSLGAEIVFQQGASAVALVQIDPADGSTLQQFQKAIDKLSTVKGINIVVPLSTNPTLQGYLKSHVETASSLTERKERTGIMGLSGSPSITTVLTYASSLATKRIALVYPPSCTRYVGTNTTVSTLDGSFIAAAVAGIRTSRNYDVADPLTRKSLTGFDGVPDTLLRAQKNQLSNGGVMVIETKGTIPYVRLQTTTDPTVSYNKEFSVVETIDFVGASCRDLLEAIFIGQKILADTPSQIKSTISAILQDLVGRQIIVGFSNVIATIDGSDPTQINVSFQVAPVNPLNYVLITFTI